MIASVASIAETAQSLVRPLVTFIFAAAIVMGFLQGRLSGETFMGTAGVIMAFWFGQRAPSQERGTVIETGSVRDVKVEAQPRS